jgi:hypothetical protein
MRGAWKKILVASVLALALGATANAGPINLIGGTAGTIPGGSGTNEFVPGLLPGPQIGGYYGSQIEVDLDTESVGIFEFFGAEAGFVNAFMLVAMELFSHPGGTIISPNLATPLDTFVTAPAIGTFLVPFSFTVNSGAGAVANGANPDDSAGLAMGPNFFASCDPLGTTAGSGGTSCQTVYLFLDDGGAGPDDNHDDMLVRLTVSEVPEPGTWLLLGAGLMGLGVLGRRRQRN